MFLIDQLPGLLVGIAFGAIGMLAGIMLIDTRHHRDDKP